jgi:uncharacterized protein
MEPLPGSFYMEALDDFLSSDESPENCMQLSDLDGFLTGIAVGPELIMPSEWLPAIWGGSSPEFVDAEQAATIIGAIMAHFNEIARCVNSNVEIKPIFWEYGEGQDIADDWALGFLDAVQLRADAWQPLIKDREARLMLMPILVLSGDPELAGSVEPDDERVDQAIEMLPAAVAGIRAYWRERTSGPKQPVDRGPPGRGRRTGRR